MGMKRINKFKKYANERFEDARHLVGPHDPEEVAAFARLLSTFSGMQLTEISPRLEGVPLPKGFLHVRFFEDMPEGKDQQMGFILGGEPGRDLVNAQHIGQELAPDRDIMGGVESWDATEALPVTLPGVLDLKATRRWAWDQDDW